MESPASWTVMLYSVGVLGVQSLGESTWKMNGLPQVPVAEALAASEPSSWTVIWYGVVLFVLL